MWCASLRTLGMSYRIFLEWAKFSTVWSQMSPLLSQYGPRVYNCLQNGLHVCETDGTAWLIPGNQGRAPGSWLAGAARGRLLCFRACSCGQGPQLDEAFPLQSTQPSKPGLEAPKAAGKPQWPLGSLPGLCLQDQHLWSFWRELPLAEFSNCGLWPPGVSGTLSGSLRS